MNYRTMYRRRTLFPATMSHFPGHGTVQVEATQAATASSMKYEGDGRHGDEGHSGGSVWKSRDGMGAGIAR